MHKYLRIIAFFLVLCLLPGCSIPFADISKMVSGSGNTASEKDGAENQDNKGYAVITGEEDSRIRTLISDYFSCLYSEPAEDYYIYSATGKLPEKIKGFISSDTISIAEGNREIGIHLPRFIEANGLVCVGYELVKNKSSDGRENPGIDAEYAGEAGGGFLYYTKVYLYARCVNTANFEKLFTMSGVDNTWTKVNADPIDENQTDTIKIEARYDVQVKKEDGNYKIAAAKEAVTTNEARSRLLIFNNDFIKRLTYLDCSAAEDGKSYAREEDGKAYEEEKALITAFFNSLKNNLDVENMKLMQTAWDRNAGDFSTFLDKLSRTGDNGTKKLTDLIEIKDDYKIKFDYCSMPLQFNMEKLDGEFSEIKIVPHPGYTKKRKIYAVSFKVPVKRMNGSVQGEECIYYYDYFITLLKTDEILKVDGIRLNEYGRVTPAGSVDNG